MIKLLNYWFPMWDFLYILQLEEYELQRYWWQVQLRLFKRGFQKRDTLKYTGRIKMTIVVLLALLGSVLLELMQMQFYVYAGLIIATLPLTTPYLIGIVSSSVSVFVNIQKKRRLLAAKTFFTSNYPDTKVIAVTGSFGKTTAKYMLQHVLQYDYEVAIIPDNINTGIGVANHLLANKVPRNTELLIVEMGAYRQGDIAQTATIVAPDVAIITILGDQHLERFGSHADLVKAKCEIFTTNTKTTGYVTTDSLALITNQNIATDQLQAVSIPAHDKSTAHLVRQLALDLGVSAESIDASIASYTPPDRRNNIIQRQGVTIIDNSYNISPMVAETMLTEAATTAQQQNKKLVVMTGGIGEQGEIGPAANKQLGELISKHAARAILHPSIYIQDVAAGLSIAFIYTPIGLDVSEQPADWLDGGTEILLWLTDHSDASYF